jgi:hypothetical protein
LKIIFIASLSHSGSTLLDMMLNAHPDVISVGELKQLERFAHQKKRRPERAGKGPNGRQESDKTPRRRLQPGRPARPHACTCGAETLSECRLWSRVNERILATTGRSLGEMNVENYDDPEGFAADNVALFQAISAASGKDYIVDSSKQRRRLALLAANPELDLFPIFLLRDPRGQIWSSMRRAVETEARLGKGPGLDGLIANYIQTNREIYKLVRHRSHAVIRYERLVEDPEATLSGLMQQVGLTFNPLQLSWAAQERHNVGGNPMRWKGSSELKRDESWRGNLSVAQQLVINAATIPGRYPFVKFGP